MRLLVLTSEYPNQHSAHVTPVTHYFAKEWVQQGHEVHVVYSRSVFPAVFYPIARAFTVLVKRIFKTEFIPVRPLPGMERTMLEGVDVISLPIFKIFPHMRYSGGTIQRHALRIQSLLATHGFVPDAIICHFLNPQLPLISELKRMYPMATTSLVIHEDPQIISGLFGSETKELVGRVDHLGFRHHAMRARYVAEHGQRPNLFLCPSGVPERFILDAVPASKFTTDPLTFCFVGMLIPLKNVDVLLQSFHSAFPAKNFRLRIIGEGFLRPELERLSADLGLGSCVRFEGRMTREEVQEVLREADVFVMVSQPEAFGLVYLEAMAKGCLTIGTRGQGIDGVIVSGQNGFLCEARDPESLRTTLQEIAALSPERRLAIAEAARQTASGLSDGKVAASYLTTLGLPTAT